MSQSSSNTTKYEQTWEPLKNYFVPEWYMDAKFGIFIHWGVYFVPAFGNEWYPRNMYKKGTPELALSPEVGPAVEVRLKGLHSYVQSREVRPSLLGRPLQERGSQTRGFGRRTPRWLRHVRLLAFTMGSGGDGSQARHPWRTGRVCAEGGNGLRRIELSGRALVVLYMTRDNKEREQADPEVLRSKEKMIGYGKTDSVA